jgi:predicted transcriptional regulator
MMEQYPIYSNLIFEEVLSSKSRCKIIKQLAQENEMNISRIVFNTGLNHVTVRKDLAFFSHIGFIQEKQFGRIKIYRFRDENAKANALKHLIQFWESEFDEL